MEERIIVMKKERSLCTIIIYLGEEKKALAKQKVKPNI